MGLNPNPDPTQYGNLTLAGRVAGRIRKLSPPRDKDVIWAYPLNGNINSDICELRVYDGAISNWVPLRGGPGSGGTVEASDVHVSLVALTEQIGGRGPGNFDGTLEEFLYEAWKRFQVPQFSYFTFKGSASVIRPVGYPYPAGPQPFTWGTTIPGNVIPDTLQLYDLTAGQELGNSLPVSGSLSPAVDGFDVVEGLSRTYQILGYDTENNQFSQFITITGRVYRFAFLSDQNLLNLDDWGSSADLSDFIRNQPGAGELVYSRVSGPRTFDPEVQYIYFAVDVRLLSGSGAGVDFVLNGLPNNNFQYRDFSFINEHGAENQMRLFRSNNLLNNEYILLTS